VHCYGNALDLVVTERAGSRPRGGAELLYRHDPDGNLVELFTEIDTVYDEATGQFEPRPWHEQWPQVPQVWGLGPAAANKWGPIDPEMMEH
jgi:hypothetical protein